VRAIALLQSVKVVWPAFVLLSASCYDLFRDGRFLWRDALREWTQTRSRRQQDLDELRKLWRPSAGR